MKMKIFTLRRCVDMKTRNLKTKTLSILLAIVMLLGMLPMSVFAADTMPSYVALGDSISTGYGLTDKTTQGFTYLLADELGYELNNLAVDGNTAADILVQLQEQSVKDAVAGADLITITAGGNDLMAVLYQAIATEYNKLDVAANAPITADEVITIMSDSSDGRRLSVMSVALGLLKKDSGIYLLDNETFTGAVANYVSTLNQVLSEIKSLNADVTVIVATQYNPYVEFNGVSYAALIDLTPIYSGMEEGVTALNKAIKNNAAAGGYIVADVKAAFDSQSGDLYVADPTTLNFDFHPNAAGHAVLAGVMEAAVPPAKVDPAYTVPTGLTATYGDTLADVSLDDGFSWQDAETTSVGNVGEKTFKVTYTPDDTDRYNVVRDIDVTLQVERAVLTFKADDVSIFVGDPIPEESDLTYSVTGFVNGEDETVLIHPPILAYNAKPDNTKAGQCPIIIGSASGSNYTPSFEAGMLIVKTRSEVNHIGKNDSIKYDGSTYDVSRMFTIDENAGEATYAIVGGDDIGTLNGSVLTVTKAGNIQIKLTTAAWDEYAAGEATATLTVEKGTATVVKPPEVISGLKFKEENGSGIWQQLVKPGEAQGGTMVYRVNDGEWSDDIPTQSMAADYNVYYKVQGDSNHNDSMEGMVSVSIAKADAPTVTIPTQQHICTIPTTGNSINIKSLLPPACAIVDGESRVDGITGDFIKNAALNNGILTYDTIAGTLGATGTIKVKFVMLNYEDVTVTINVELIFSPHVHSFGADWKADGTNHWRECSCGAKAEEAVHSGGTASCKDKAVCSVCGVAYGELAAHTYKDGKCTVCEAADPNYVPETNSPQTGDNSHMALWIALLFISGGAVITLIIYAKKKRKNTI